MPRKTINRDELASSQRGRKKINDNFLELYSKQETDNQQLATITTQSTVVAVANVFTLDLSTKKSFTIDLTDAPSKTVAFSNIPADLDFASPVVVKVIASVGSTIGTYPTGTVWQNGETPVFTATKTSYLTFIRTATGWHGTVLGEW